jgi:hypothetical protein
VKDARSEAQKEIEEYKSSKDDEFKSFENKVFHLPDIQSPDNRADALFVALER